MINITESAVTKIKSIFAEDDTLSSMSLRIFVQGGGCSGMSYGFSFDEETNEDDFTFDKEGVKVVVDSMSMQYLRDSEISYKDDLNGSSFAINNPSATSSCGCGSSFSV